MSKQKLPRIPFKYDFYIAYWKDIETDPSWREMSDILKSEPCLCVSTGWLVRKDDKVHILMSDFNYKKSDLSLGDGGASTVIPSCNVVKLIKVKLNV
tara:strand:+ start:1229 stop:1519 length:291 start_codon:yes stop_codon:yes gene_type:complete